MLIADSLAGGWEVMYFPNGWLGAYVFPCRVAGSLCISLAGGWEVMYFPGGWLRGYVFPWWVAERFMRLHLTILILEETKTR